MKEMTYKEALAHLWQFVKMVAYLLPRTFVRQTKAILLNHPLYVIVFFVIIGWQAHTIAYQRVDRDIDSVKIWKLQHELDSIGNKQVKYYSIRK